MTLYQDEFNAWRILRRQLAVHEGAEAGAAGRHLGTAGRERRDNP